MASNAYKEGDDVYVFYRMGKRCMPQRKYMATLDARHGAFRPRIGMSDGWVPAKVVEVEKDRAKVEYSWANFFTMRGHMADPDSGWAEWFFFDEMRPSSDGVPRQLIARNAQPPELALLTFRWGGLNEVIPPGQWGETGSSVSDLFIDSFVNSAVAVELGTSFEIWTVYIEDHSDLRRIADAASLIFGPTHPLRRAKHVGAMYHLYPTGFEENCIPNRETGQDGGAALVNQKALFTLIQAVERAGIPTRFPHPSGFYELLTSKRWTSLMSLTPSLRVPPTVALPRMLIEQGCGLAAKYALESLNKVKQQQAVLQNLPRPLENITKGVAKLGFSWEALDVKMWEKEEGLENAIYQLTQTIEISQEITGQPHDLETIMIQEYCVHDIESRFYVVDGKVETTIYTKFCKVKENLEFGDFHELFSKKEAAMQWMGGDMAAMESGERQCLELVDRWLCWVQAQICELPPAIRFDFFVGRGAKPGEAIVWTLEICELGFSMLGAKDLPVKVFKAMLRKCLGRSEGAAIADGNAWPVSRQANPQKTEQPDAPAQTTKKAQKEAKGAASVKVEPESETVSGEGQAAASADSGDDEGPPKMLTISMGKPAGATPDQQVCIGTYKLMPDKANGHPVWEHTSEKRFLFHGIDDCWYVGDEEERDMRFDCDQGYIRHQDSGDTFPHKLTGFWQRGPDWTDDATVFASKDGKRPAEIDQGSSKGKGKAKGKGKRR
mmetsp:Transcript_122120/g.353035  ORF Transcript_122120/g.353035 Transcript_122120/m.353035 type:complete len:722 (-) Transcript_122120:87-2252(-)